MEDVVTEAEVDFLSMVSEFLHLVSGPDPSRIYFTARATTGQQFKDLAKFTRLKTTCRPVLSH